MEHRFHLFIDLRRKSSDEIADGSPVSNTEGKAARLLGIKEFEKPGEPQRTVTPAVASSIHPIDHSLDHEGIKDSNPDAGTDAASSDDEMSNPSKPPNMPPCLEESIPLEFFPDILIAKDDAGGIIQYHSLSGTHVADKVSALLDKPVQFKRVLPSPANDPKRPSSSVTPTLRVAELRLSLNWKLGVGNHSDVYLVPMRLPRPLSARTPTGEVAVACKMAHERSDHGLELLDNEAKIYSSFPDHFFEEWIGYNLLTPKFKDPVPVGPIAPKFYGYYKPIYDSEYYAEEERDLDDESKANVKSFIEGLSPILLMEYCGEPIRPREMPEHYR